MSEIQQNRYDQLLRRVCDLKGPGSKVSWAVGDVLPTIDVEQTPPELLALSGTRIASGLLVLAAGGAGNFSRAQLFNPAGSNAVIRVTRIFVSSENASNFTMGITSTELTASTGTEATLDGRLTGEGTIGQVQGANNAAVVTQFPYQQKIHVARGVPIDFDVGPVLTPGTGLEIDQQTANLDMFVSFVWTERVAQPSELNL